MNVAKIALDANKARELYRKYKAHQVYETDLDREIRRTYQLISQGKVIIQALDAIKQAGVDADGLPKLALAGATAKHCYIRRHGNGRMEMRDAPFFRFGRGSRKTISHEYPASSFDFQAGTFSQPSEWQLRTGTYQSDHRAAVPVIPLHLRPKKALQSYHVLWEAEWTPTPPVDPYLLRRIGKSDLWVVCAAWDLTEVERAVMSTRIVGN